MAALVAARKGNRKQAPASEGQSSHLASQSHLQTLLPEAPRGGQATETPTRTHPGTRTPLWATLGHRKTQEAP